jgi:hypothetical protein
MVNTSSTVFSGHNNQGMQVGTNFGHINNIINVSQPRKLIQGTMGSIRRHQRLLSQRQSRLHHQQYLFDAIRTS